LRSLVSCIFAGLFFSATLVRRTGARALIVALAAPLAIAMNFLRSLALTLMANGGINIAGTWHDLTGFAVLSVTVAMLGGLALLLERHERATTPVAPSPMPSAPPPGRAAPFAALVGALGIAAALAVFFAVNTRSTASRDVPAPDLLALLPAESAGWAADTSRELFQFQSTLRTEFLAQRTYPREGPHGLDQATLYLACWRPGQAPVNLVASHTPDACWPGSGWTMLESPPLTNAPVITGRELPRPEQRLFRAMFPQYVWFWHLYDGRPITYRDPYSAIELLRIAWRFGFRKGGDQVFVRDSSNRPLDTLSREPLFADFFTRAAKLGL
jgi:exosortase/archaeosortase family protein